MPDSSLVPERQLVFSPALAATIGLGEAILLQHLQALFDHHRAQLRDGHAWLSVERDYLLRSLPFWNAQELQRYCRSLADKGVLLLDSTSPADSPRLVFALNERRSRQESPPPVPAELPRPRRGAHPLPLHWAPGEDLLQLLALNHTIPRQFALDQLEDFVFYWRERGEVCHAWESRFRQHVLSAWRREQQHRAEAFRSDSPEGLEGDWQPGADAVEIMLRAGIEPDFIREAIPEFVLYWRERGDAPKELNSKFIQHVRIQWARYTSSLEHSTEPRRIPPDWQPSADVYDILRLSHIDTGFADALLPEFIVFWRDSNQAQTSWNSKFLQHVKYHWAKRHQAEQTGHHHAGQQGTHSTGRTRDRSLRDDLTDTSWAG